MKKGLRSILMILALLLAAVTALAEIQSDQGWIRIWDFPRLAIFSLCVIVGLAGAFLWRGNRRWILLVLLVAAAGWQAFRIFPYTPLAGHEVAKMAPDAQQCFSVMTYNVLQDNRNFGEASDLISGEAPDILLLLETDQKWTDAMAATLSTYSTVLREPLDNKYGLIFATNLAVDDASVEYLVEKDVPSVFARMRTPGGVPFYLAALHPKPPHLGKSSAARDGEIAIAARRSMATQLPSIAMGDFNDVAWSHTSRLFRRTGRYLDLRVGRGFYATFPASWPAFRWPLDHVFVTEEFLMTEMETLPATGSDHMPVKAGLCLQPQAGEALNEGPQKADSGDRKEMRDTIEKAEPSAAKSEFEINE